MLAPDILLFSLFSDVKVQIEAEDASMMQQLKAEDFVCFGAFLYLPDKYLTHPLGSSSLIVLMLVCMIRLLCWMKTGRMSCLSR